MKLFLKFNLFLLYVYWCFACWYVCVPCTCGARGGQKGAWDPMELKLEVGMSHHMGVGNQTWVSARAANVLEF